MEGHSSGNPVPWDIEAGADAKEYFSMIHVKKGDYAHWAVRIDKASRRVTHVSAGPLIKARDYRNEVRHPPPPKATPRPLNIYLPKATPRRQFCLSQYGRLVDTPKATSK